ncbi:hypothetical protein OAO87_04080 [bacterium]|nr:hypothetical protein [bacterium]
MLCEGGVQEEGPQRPSASDEARAATVCRSRVRATHMIAEFGSIALRDSGRHVCVWRWGPAAAESAPAAAARRLRGPPGG